MDYHGVPGTVNDFLLGAAMEGSDSPREKECRSCGLCKPEDTCTTSVLLAKNHDNAGRNTMVGVARVHAFMSASLARTG